jgi:hypothetical protein
VLVQRLDAQPRSQRRRDDLAERMPELDRGGGGELGVRVGVEPSSSKRRGPSSAYGKSSASGSTVAIVM